MWLSNTPCPIQNASTVDHNGQPCSRSTWLVTMGKRWHWWVAPVGVPDDPPPTSETGPAALIFTVHATTTTVDTGLARLAMSFVEG